MSKVVHIHSHPVRAADGTEYRAHIHGDERKDGTWAGWIEFRPSEGSGTVLRTRQETSQPDWKALDYWAGGLEPIFLEGALRRAK